nr:RelA/SpoT domain-containing protein [uncultured Cohaesibacter sp.]
MERLRSAIIFIGADSFKSRQLRGSPAFFNSKKEIENYFNTQEKFFFKDKFDLFNSDDFAEQQIHKIGNFIQKICKSEVEFLFLIYIGHGEFRSSKDDYFWAVKKTSHENIYNTAIDVKTLGHSLKSLRRSTKCICIVDACFSGATANAFMSSSGPAEEIKKRSKHILPANHGSLVISSSSRDRVSLISHTEELTLFTRSLVKILHTRSAPEILTAPDLASRCYDWMQTEEPEFATEPQVFAPYQAGEPLLSKLLFPQILIRENKEMRPSHQNIEVENKSNDIFSPTKDELEEIRDLIECGKILEKKVVSSIDNSTIKPKLYAYYSRTKDFASFEDKIKRKRKERIRDGSSDKYSVSSVTDVVGVRLITLFREDISAILTGLCKIISGESDKVTSMNPFWGDSPKVTEACAYYSDTFPNARTYALEAAKIISDHFSTQIGYAEKQIKLVEVTQRDDYSSIHIVVKTNVQSETKSSEVLVPLEFQIRSVFEDTWAQIDHKLRYSKTRVTSENCATDNAVLMEREGIPPSAEKSLKLLKRMLDNSGELTEIIRSDVNGPPPQYSKHTPAMGFADDFSGAVSSLGGNPSIFEQFNSLLRKKDELDKSYFSLGEIATSDKYYLAKIRARYGTLAEDLNDLSEQTPPPITALNTEQTNRLARFYYYSLKMEEAFCRVFSSAPSETDEIREALSIYQSLIPEFEDYPPLHFRLAQSHHSLGAFQKAIESMRACLELINSPQYQNMNFDHKLSENQNKTIRKNATRLLGYYIWTGIEDRRRSLKKPLSPSTSIEIVKQFDEAIEVTFKGLTDAVDEDVKMRNLNNIVAYLNDVFELEGRFENTPSSLPSMKGKKYTEIFEELLMYIDVNNHQSISRLETLATGYDILGDNKNSFIVARRIIKLIEEEELIARGEIPPAEVQDIFSRATNIVMKNLSE